ncbi:phosphoribosylanthranilate isomerase [Desulfocurvus sp. DL9XJH121]
MRPCPLVQVAGVHDADEALALARLGVDSVGLPLRLAVHAPDCTEAEAARIVAALPPGVLGVCITYARDPAEVDELCTALGAGGVQIHADPPLPALAELRRRRPDLYLIKSVIVPPDPGPRARRELEARALALAPHCDALLTDTADPASAATGATGLTHDWEVSRRLAEISPRPLILAGGLNPGNIREAILTVRPAGVDAHTGLEGPDGRKDPRLVAAFVARAREAFASLGRPLPPARD